MPVRLEEIYDRFDSELGVFVRSRVGDPDAAEDVLQDVYLTIHARVGTVRDDEKLGAWVFRVARNAITEYYRAKKPMAELRETPEAPTDPTEAELEARLAKTVRNMLEGLPPEHREALYLTEYEGLTQKELAGRLGIGLSGAKSRVQRARTNLKALLLDCCHFEIDRRGGVIDYYERELAPEDRSKRPL